jgi:hypothetical protein
MLGLALVGGATIGGLIGLFTALPLSTSKCGDACGDACGARALVLPFAAPSRAASPLPLRGNISEDAP